MFTPVLADVGSGVGTDFLVPRVGARCGNRGFDQLDLRNGVSNRSLWMLDKVALDVQTTRKRIKGKEA